MNKKRHKKNSAFVRKNKPGYRAITYGGNKFSTPMKIITAISLILLVLVVGIAIAAGRGKPASATELPKEYTESLKEVANLVNVDGYYAGVGTLNGVKHYRYQVEENGIKSYDMDTSEIRTKAIFCDEASDDTTKSKLGKCYAYERTYKLDDGSTKTGFYYELYVSKDTLKDCGTLESDDGSEE